MCDLDENIAAKKIFREKHLVLLHSHGCYAIFRDCDFWYIGRINRNYEPIELFEGIYQDVIKIYCDYAITGVLDLDVLEKH